MSGGRKFLLIFNDVEDMAVKWDSPNFNGESGMGFPGQERDIMDLEKRILQLVTVNSRRVDNN